MGLLELFHLRSKLLEEFEQNFEKMNFKSEKEKLHYYHAFQDGMAEFFAHSMITIMDADTSSTKKAA